MNAWKENGMTNKSNGVVADPREAALQVPLASQAAFWRPRHCNGSPALAHVPYLYWLLETTNPRAAVQVGLSDGLLYMSMCDGVERLGGRAVCLAFRQPGDAIDEQIYEEHDRLYGGLSIIVEPGTSIDPLVPEGSLDFLLINTSVSEENALHLAEQWEPRLSDRAVVVIFQSAVDRDSNTEALADLLDPDKRRRVIGCNIAGRSRLDVLLYGSNQHHRLRRLIDEGGRVNAQLALRQVFGRLGEALHAEQRVKELTVDLGVLEKDLSSVNAVLNQREREVKAATQQLERERLTVEMLDVKTEAYALRLEELGSLLATHEAENSSLRASIVSLTEQMDLQTAELEELKDKVQYSQNALANKESEISRAQAALNKAYGEVELRHAKQMNDLAERDKEIARLQAALQRASEEVEMNYTKQIDDLTAEVARLGSFQQQLDAIFESTSWRITKPIRWLKRCMLGFRSSEKKS